MKTIRFYFMFGIALSLIFSACGPATTAMPSNTPVMPITATAVPLPSPTPTETPDPLPLVVIGPASASQLVQMASFGDPLF